MTTPDGSTSLDGVLPIVARLAASNSDALLPCPRCLATVRVANLEKHLRTEHAIELGVSTSSAVASFVVRGDARFLRIPSVVALSVCIVFAIGFVAVSDPISDTTMAIAALGLLLAAVPSVVTHLGLVSVELELDGERLRLAWPNGTTIRELRGPFSLGVGSLRATRMRPGGTSDVDAGADVVRVGSYLRLESARRSIVIGALGTVGVDRRWSAEELRRSTSRRAWDITLDRTSFVALEYHLASLGLLRPIPR